jgi:hypothetical protein
MLDALLVGLALLAMPPAEADTPPPSPTLTLEQALASSRPGLAAARLAAEFAELDPSSAKPVACCVKAQA